MRPKGPGALLRLSETPAFLVSNLTNIRYLTGLPVSAGMVLALEPIATTGKGAIKVARDGWTLITKDGSWASHHEHTILVESSGVTILTKRPSEI